MTLVLDGLTASPLVLVSASHQPVLRAALIGLTEAEAFIAGQVARLETERAKREARRILKVVQSARGAIVDTLGPTTAAPKPQAAKAEQLDLLPERPEP